MNHRLLARTLVPALVLAMLASPALAQRGRKAQPQAMPYSYIEYAMHNRHFSSAGERDSGDGQTLRLSYQSSSNVYLFYYDGETDYDTAGRSSSTGYGLGLLFSAGDRGLVSLEAEYARSEDPAGRVSATRASGSVYRLIYTSPITAQSALELAYVREQFSGADSNRYEFGWLYRADARWTFGVRLGEDIDSDSDRSETRILLRYHY